MPFHATEPQRDLMRFLFRLYPGDQKRICAAYARAEADGRAARDKAYSRLSPEAYAKQLLADGMAERWIID